MLGESYASRISECAGEGVLIQTSPKEAGPMPGRVGVAQAVIGRPREKKRLRNSGRQDVCHCLGLRVPVAE